MIQMFVDEVNTQDKYNKVNGPILAVPIVIDNNKKPYGTDITLFDREIKYLHDNGFMVNGWNDVCNQTMAKSWPNNEIICPITHGRALMNTTDGSSSGHPHEIPTTWHVDARAVWQNTTNDGQPMSQGNKNFTQCFNARGMTRCENSAGI